VLAAGASRRMGANKLLLMLDGEPLVRRASRRALAAGLEPLVVVLGHESERVQLALADLPCRFAFNASLRAHEQLIAQRARMSAGRHRRGRNHAR